MLTVKPFLAEQTVGVVKIADFGAIHNRPCHRLKSHGCVVRLAILCVSPPMCRSMS